MIIRFFIFGAFYFLPDLFIRSGIKALYKKNSIAIKKRYQWVSVIFFLLIIFFTSISKILPPSINRAFSYFIGLFAGIVLFKLAMAFILILQDIVRLPMSFLKKKSDKQSGKKIQLLSRRTFIVKTSILVGALPFSGMLYGMIRGKHQFTIHYETFYFDDLPKEFDGLSITQFSDLHIGSWNYSEKKYLEKLKTMIQDLQSDILVFTGDIVNSRATEMHGWFEVFQSLSAPLGKFSILGNHDYGDYVDWKNEEAKEENLKEVKNIHPKLGFQLLLNEHISIKKNNTELFIVGVENWGKGDFPKFGDIEKASAGIPSNAFKILLSHDPSHWDAKILSSEFPPQLTLSGHTHGFQMGIETPAFRFSPSQWVYEQWAGAYEKNNKIIYVNRGVGTVGYPGRIGIWPEITKIILKRK